MEVCVQGVYEQGAGVHELSLGPLQSWGQCTEALKE